MSVHIPQFMVMNTQDSENNEKSSLIQAALFIKSFHLMSIFRKIRDDPGYHPQKTPSVLSVVLPHEQEPRQTGTLSARR